MYDADMEEQHLPFPEIKDWSAKGGKARANVLTPDERREIARNAVRARWAKAGKLKQPLEPAAPEVPQPATAASPAENLPFSMFRGMLKIGAVEMECHVLNDGRRVFTQTEMVRVLTAGKGSTNLDVHVRGNPLITHEIAAKKIV